MKSIIQITLVFTSLMLGVQTTWAASQPNEQRLAFVHKSVIIEKYNAIESDKLRISLGAGNSGFVEGQVCDSCEPIKVEITPATKAYDNNVEVPLKSAKSRLGRYATVIYEIETKNVTEIRW